LDIPVELSRILITEYGEQQVIFLKELGGERSFPILIGLGEALAIDRRLKGHQSPRPMTHDLLAGVITSMGGQLEKIVVNDLRDHTFIATLHIRRGNQVIEVDSRPSDAIALGVAFETPMFVAEHVFAEVLREPTTTEERIEMLRQRMGMLKERCDELSDRLADKNFLSHASDTVVAEHRRQLSEMQNEYEAIRRVLSKLG